MQRKFIKGDTIEDCLDSLDLILQSWAPRLGQYITGIIPPVPILHHQLLPDAEGNIFKMLLPFSGKIVASYIGIGKYNVKPATVSVWSTGGSGIGGTKIICDRPMHTYITDKWYITAGCLLEATVDPPNAIEDINIGALVYVDIEHSYKEQLLLNALENLK